MKIQSLKIDGYKNLNNFEIYFEKNSSVNALIGVNGSGKSNVIEAILEIFIRIKHNQPTSFSYEIFYELDGVTIPGVSKSVASETGKDNYIEIIPDKKNQLAENDSTSLDEVKKEKIYTSKATFSFLTKAPTKIPSTIFLYYAGETSRLKDKCLDEVDKEFLKAVRKDDRAMIKYVSFISLADFPLILLANFLFEVEMYEKIRNLTQITNIQNSVTFYLSRPNWNKSALLTEDSFWNASGVLATTLHELKDIGVFTMIDKNSAKIMVKSLSKLKECFENSYDMFVKLKMLMQADLLDRVNYSIVKNEEEWNPFSVEALSEGEKQLSLLLCFLTVTREYRSLFLLDEMDAYLHPSWQREFTSIISDIEIRGQVLMTTHSPLTLGKMNKENIRILKDGEVFEPSADTMNRDIVEVLGEIMDVGARPKEVEEYITGFKSAVAFKNRDLAEEYQEKLKKHLGETDPFWNTVDVLMRRLNR